MHGAHGSAGLHSPLGPFGMVFRPLWSATMIQQIWVRADATQEGEEGAMKQPMVVAVVVAATVVASVFASVVSVAPQGDESDTAAVMRRLGLQPPTEDDSASQPGPPPPVWISSSYLASSTGGEFDTADGRIMLKTDQIERVFISENGTVALLVRTDTGTTFQATVGASEADICAVLECRRLR